MSREALIDAMVTIAEADHMDEALVIDTDALVRDLCGQIMQLKWHLGALIDQCERGNLTDDLGHAFKMNKVLLDARNLMNDPKYL